MHFRYVLTALALSPLAATAVEGLQIDMQEVDGVPSARAEAILDAPPERVWDVVDRCADYKNTLVSVRESKELARTDTTRRCELTVEMPFPLPNLTGTTDATVESVPGKLWRRSWQLVDGDYRKNSGSWTLTPESNQRTRVVYTLIAQPKMPVPQFALRMGQQQAIPKLFDKLEAQAQGRVAGIVSPLSE